MATINGVVTTIEGDGSALLCLWETLTNANTTGTPLAMMPWADRCVQVVGTFDSATVVIQGSNDGTNWATLADPQGNALSFTATGLEAILELPRYIRPSTSGGGGSQDIDVYLVARRANTMRT